MVISGRAIIGHSSVRIRGGRRLELARVTCTVRVLALATRRPDPEALFHSTSDIRAAKQLPQRGSKRDNTGEGGGNWDSVNRPRQIGRKELAGREGKDDD